MSSIINRSIPVQVFVFAGILLFAGCATTNVAPSGYTETNGHVTVNAHKDQASILMVDTYVLREFYRDSSIRQSIIGDMDPCITAITQLNHEHTGYNGAQTIEVTPGYYTLWASSGAGLGYQGISAPNLPFVAGVNKVYVTQCRDNRVKVAEVKGAVYKPAAHSFVLNSIEYRIPLEKP